MMYRREIDGLRAIAVVPVILFHAGFVPFSGGYVGVDVFFVISGYLITSLLIEDLEQGRFSLRRFYERRARRILPALFFVLLCCLPFAWLWMLPSQFRDFSQGLVAVSLFSSNLLFWQKANYFAPAAEENPLLHTWSLAVEEQFYIFFPLFLLSLWRLGRGNVLRLLIGLSLASLLLAEWGWRNAPTASFYLLPTRAWELGAGAIAAFFVRDRGVQRSDALSLAGLGLILWSVLVYDETTPFPSLFALVPVGGAVLILVCGRSDTLVGRLLANRGAVGIGLISYSAYLWHQPLFAFARISNATHPSPATFLLLTGLTFVLAYLTWCHVEQPFRQKPAPWLQSPRAIFSASGAMICAVGLIGAYGEISDGRFDIWKRMYPETARTYALIEAAGRTKGTWHDNGACRFNTPDLTPQVVSRLLVCRDRYGPGTAILGDSHSIDVFNGLYTRGKAPFIFGLTRDSCRPHTPSADCPYEVFAAFVTAHPGLFAQTVFIQAGFYLLQTDQGDTGRQIIAEVPEVESLDPQAYAVNDLFVTRVLAYLERLETGTQVIWLGPRIEPHIGRNFILQNGCNYPYELRPGLAAVFQHLDTAIATASAGRIDYVSLLQATGFEMSRDFLNCNRAYWMDGDHWSMTGAGVFVGRLLQARALQRL